MSFMRRRNVQAVSSQAGRRYRFNRAFASDSKQCFLSKNALWLALLVILLTACGPVANLNQPPASALPSAYTYTSPPTHVAHGDVTFADMQFPDTVNPLFANSTVDFELDNALWGQPVFYDQHFHVYPDELTVVPLPTNGGVRDGGKTIIMHVRHDLRWSDGQPIVAGDFRYWWLLDQDSNTGATVTSGYDQIARIDTPDRYTVVLHMKSPFGPYLYYLPYAAPQHAWSKYRHIDLQSLPAVFLAPTVTSGPYQLGQLVNNQSYTLLPNPNYVSTTFHGPFLAHLTYRAYASASALSLAAQQQAADVTTGYLSDTLPDFSPLPSTVQLLQVPAAAYEHLDFNNAKPLFQSLNVRKAMALAINVCAMLQSVLHTADCSRRTTQVEPPPSHFFDPSILPIPYDPTQARQLLALDGWQPGPKGILLKNGQTFTLRLVTTSNDAQRMAVATWLQHDLLAVGIQVQIVYADLSTFFALYTKGGILATGNYDLALFSYANSPEPDDEYQVFASSQIPSATAPDLGNYARINDPLLDQALLAGRATTILSQRVQAYRRFLERLATQLYIIPLFVDMSVMTADTRMHNVIPNPDQSANTWNIADWWTS